MRTSTLAWTGERGASTAGPSRPSATLHRRFAEERGPPSRRVAGEQTGWLGSALAGRRAHRVAGVVAERSPQSPLRPLLPPPTHGRSSSSAALMGLPGLSLKRRAAESIDFGTQRAQRTRRKKKNCYPLFSALSALSVSACSAFSAFPSFHAPKPHSLPFRPGGWGRRIEPRARRGTRSVASAATKPEIRHSVRGVTDTDLQLQKLGDPRREMPNNASCEG